MLEERRRSPFHRAHVIGPGEYLEHLSQIKQAVAIPVIASLNGFTHGGWLEYAALIE